MTSIPQRTRWAGISRFLVLLVGALVLRTVGAAQPEEDWVAQSPRDELRPVFEQEGDGRLRIRTDERDGLDGHWERQFPVKGGAWYRFRTERRVENVPVPRRSVLVRIRWSDDEGRPVRRDSPGARSFAPGEPPVSEPDYPVDGIVRVDGWMEISGVYHAPPKATRAIIELHLRWATNAMVEWRAVELAEHAPPAPRRVRLATVHYVPKGGTTAMDSCRQFAPMIAQAASEKADPDQRLRPGLGREVSG